MLAPSGSEPCSSLRILLAEDSVIDQIIAREILEQLGCRADLAKDGTEVLEALQRQDYDVVLMDTHMPQMDGITTAREIGRRLPAGRRPWLVAMAADTGEADRRSYLANGMDDYLGKPIVAQDLATVLSRVRPRERASGPPGKASPAAVPQLDAGALGRLRETLGAQADSMLPALLEDFIADGKRLLAEAQLALAQGNLPDLRRAAHSLKSNAATFGAVALSLAAKELENLARQGTAEGALALVERSQQEFEKARTGLEEYRKGACHASQCDHLGGR